MNYQLKSILTIMAIVLLVSTGCQKDWETFEPENDVPLSEISIDSDFDWKTTKDAVITFAGSDSGVIYIKSEDGEIYHKAYLTSGNEYTAKITVPSYILNVIISFKANNETLSLVRDDIFHTFS